MAHSGKSITFATDLLPNENNTYYLGSSTATWKIYGNLTGTATTASALSNAPTIKNSSGTAVTNLDANTSYTLNVGGKSVSFKTPADANTNTLVNYYLSQTTKAYLMGSSNAPSTTTSARSAIGDTLVYLTSTTGQLSSKSISINDGASSPAEKVQLQWNNTDSALEFVFV